jgi:predicted HicB family RNase H-like nuclease
VSDVTVLHFDLDDELHRQAKAQAAIEGVPLKDWVAQAIEQALAQRETDEPKRRPRR